MKSTETVVLRVGALASSVSVPFPTALTVGSSLVPVTVMITFCVTAGPPPLSAIVTANVSVTVSPAARYCVALLATEYVHPTAPEPSPVESLVMVVSVPPSVLPASATTATVCVSERSRSKNLIEPLVVRSGAAASSVTPPVTVESGKSMMGLSRSITIAPST